MKSAKLKERVEKYQNEVWEMAEKCDTNLMKLKDKIYESGLVVEESKCLMNLSQDETDEELEEYMNILKEMRTFYRKMMNQQLL
ncbi:hypothetical protein CN939_30670 [Bacillus thuringiensis]|uniref:hypothetical protein n=1 Tax=Bacillus thuringiensis TaxID=1428 RepID=UPI000BEC5D85|nr:hypothetical protein [Bacillus thuringiensis]PEF83372.1 hypothetical protein CON51_32380 [Bacillus thuringiensis]PES58646.1 hypothetical protein CN506_07390 [Bacillus thuringiensis]PFS65348.1 hypothetical protein COK64_03150 [Bacillus thuringiensis]PGL56952.1 hypothetical protein CN939_30670 [Bacillus thuringiensis]